MGMRITTNMMMNTYRYNLQQSTGLLDGSLNKVLTQRNFNSYAEDPAAATHAWRVRRSLTNNAGYQTNNSEAYTRLHSAWITMGSINNNLLNGDGGAKDAIKRADNDPTGGARTALGKVLNNLADSIVFSMNGAKYGDHFLFSGNDELNPPFTWQGNKLLYRGVNVDAGTVKAPDAMPPKWGDLIPEGTPKLGDGETYLEEAWVEYYRDGGLNPLNHTPEWVDDYKKYQEAYKEYLANPTGEDGPTPPEMPEEMTALDDAWLEYLQTPDDDPDKEKLNPQSKDNAPDWTDVANPDVKKLPESMPTDRKRLTSTWEKIWYDYYTDQAKDPVPADAAPDPRTVDPTQYEWYQNYLSDPEAVLPKEGDDNYPDNDIEKAWLEYAYDQRDVKKLEIMSKEEKNMDLGMGLKEESGDRDLIQSTAFNRALPGINMLGFGADADGDPKNIATIMKRLAEIYSHCDEETGEFATEAEEEEAYRLLDKFNQAHNDFNKAYSEVDTKSEFLVANGTRLKDQGYNLKEQIADIEQVDLADAIKDFSWAYYCYSSALKIGNQLLSQSLIDYMR